MPDSATELAAAVGAAMAVARSTVGVARTGVTVAVSTVREAVAVGLVAVGTGVDEPPPHETKTAVLAIANKKRCACMW